VQTLPADKIIAACVIKTKSSKEVLWQGWWGWEKS